MIASNKLFVIYFETLDCKYETHILCYIIHPYVYIYVHRLVGILIHVRRGCDVIQLADFLGWYRRSEQCDLKPTGYMMHHQFNIQQL